MSGDNENILEDEKNYKWREDQEMMLKIWADKSVCYKLMHIYSMQKYWCLNNWFNIPVIIITTVTGTGNFAISGFEKYKEYVMIMLGVFNILAAILASISNFLSNPQKLESQFSKVG